MDIQKDEDVRLLLEFNKQKKMKTLYCFDFDGTITKRDTMFMFLKFYSPSKFYLQFILYIPFFVLIKLKITDAERIKKRFITSIIGRESKDKIEKQSYLFFQEKFSLIIRQGALSFIQDIDRRYADCFIVTSSLDFWVKPFSDYLNMKLIATETKFENNMFSGDFKTKNCSGQEKVDRIKLAIEGKEYNKIVAYGNSSGDKDMLEWADKSYYRYFH